MRPRVVMLSAFLTPFRSGAEACVEEVAAELCEQFDMIIVTGRYRRGLPRKDKLVGHIPIVRVGLGCKYDKWLYPILAPLAARRLRPDLIHAVMESFAGLALMLCRYISKAPRLLTCQSANTTLLVGAMHKSADRVSVISRALQKRAAAFGRKDAVLIANGLRLEDIPQESEKVFGRILFAGRLRKVKGIDTLLKAMAHVKPHAHLHIVGDGPLMVDLKRLANVLAISDRVKFLGFMPVPDVYSEFAAAEIFCGLSRREAFGNVFVEAQAAACAVVGTTVGGIPDIVTNGETGLLVEPDDLTAASVALNDLLENTALRHEIALAGKQSAQKYDWSRIAKQYANVYLDMLS